MRYSLLLLLLLSLSAAAQNDIFEQLLQIRQAERFFKAERYRDAELTLLPIYHTWHMQPDTDADQMIKVLEMLATSRSQQGRHESVLDLLLEQHHLIARHYHEHGSRYAGSLARVAEAHYRDGQKYDAIDFVQRSLAIYYDLNPPPIDTIKKLRGNLVQYRLAPFSNDYLPLDLSEFYSRCERLQQGESGLDATILMQPFVEVGVDYIPTGSWITYFELLRVVKPDAAESPFVATDTNAVNTKRRIFLPNTSAWHRDDLCIVDESDDAVINALTDAE